MRYNCCDMARKENLRSDTPKEALAAVFEECDGVTYVVNPWVELLRALAEVGRTAEGALPTIRLLATDGVLRAARKDFTLGSKLADLEDAGHLELRVDTAVTESRLITDGEAVYSPVVVGRQTSAVVDTDETFVAETYETLGDQWETADQFDLRTPGRNTVRETMSAEFGTDTQDDFETVVTSIEGGRSSRELDEVIVSLLVAAKNELLLYDISKWGENVGLASKATFSRRKNDLEEMGIVETEKSPTDVGRPRQRLKLTDERLQQADSDQLAAVAQNVLH